MNITDEVAEAVAKTTWPDLWATVDDANKRLLLEGARRIFTAGLEAGQRDTSGVPVAEADRVRMARALRNFGMSWCSGKAVQPEDAYTKVGPLNHFIVTARTQGN